MFGLLPPAVVGLSLALGRVLNGRDFSVDSRSLLSRQTVAHYHTFLSTLACSRGRSGFKMIALSYTRYCSYTALDLPSLPLCGGSHSNWKPSISRCRFGVRWTCQAGLGRGVLLGLFESRSEVKSRNKCFALKFYESFFIQVVKILAYCLPLNHSWYGLSMHITPLDFFFDIKLSLLTKRECVREVVCHRNKTRECSPVLWDHRTAYGYTNKNACTQWLLIHNQHQH